MNLQQCETWARRVRHTGWFDDLCSLGRSIRSRDPAGRLMIVGHPEDEPWHLTAHLEMLAQFRGLPELWPTLARGDTLDAQRTDTVLVVAERQVPDRVLEQVHDARVHGSNVFGICVQDPQLEAIAHETLRLDPAKLDVGIPGIAADFELAGHLFTVAAAAKVPRRGSANLLRRLRFGS